MHVLLVPFLIFAVFPFYHMALTSLKQNKELYDRDAVPLLIRQGPTLDHYTKLLWETGFLTWTKNASKRPANSSASAVAPVSIFPRALGMVPSYMSCSVVDKLKQHRLPWAYFSRSKVVSQQRLIFQ